MGFDVANKPLPYLCMNVTVCKEMYLIINPFLQYKVYVNICEDMANVTTLQIKATFGGPVFNIRTTSLYNQSRFSSYGNSFILPDKNYVYTCFLSLPGYITISQN